MGLYSELVYGYFLGAMTETSACAAGGSNFIIRIYAPFGSSKPESALEAE